MHVYVTLACIVLLDLCQSIKSVVVSNSGFINFFRPMEVFTKFDTVKRSTIFIERSQVILQHKCLNIYLANSTDTDEMTHYVAFQVSLHCLPKYRFRVFQSSKGSVKQC